MVIVVMMVVVVVVVMTMPSDHHHRPPCMRVMMMVMMMGLGQLDGAFGPGRRTFIHRPKPRHGIRNRLKQIGIGIGLQHVDRCRSRCGLRSVQ